MDCVFSGSYYDPSPWTERPCDVSTEVPAGCPIEVAMAETPDITVERDGATIASTRAVVGTDAQTFTLPDEDSCTCEPIEIAVDFQRVAISVPGAVAGDLLVVNLGGTPVEIAVTAAAPCVDSWPAHYEVALACDRCPVDDPAGGAPAAGCNATGAPLWAIAFVALLRRPREPARRGATRNPRRR